jgi:hypothetical protein
MKRAVVAIAAGGLLVAGGTVAGISLMQGTARADSVAACIASLGSGTQCTLSDVAVPDPSSIYAQLQTPSGTKGLSGTLTWTLNCPTTGTAQTGSRLGSIPSIIYLAQGINISGSQSCQVTINMRVSGFTANSQNASLTLDYDEGTGTGAGNPTPNPSGSVPSGGISGVIKGFDGKCVNDSGNSRALLATVNSYACGSAKGKTWRYASGELIHNGLCLNDKGNGGNGSKLNLYTCTGTPQEIWIYNSLKHVYTLRSHNFGLCITIPNSSTKNGIQLRANTCHDGANQHWTLP